MFQFLARVDRDEDAGTVTLTLIRDGESAQLAGGLEFVTVTLDVDPFDRPVNQ